MDNSCKAKSPFKRFREKLRQAYSNDPRTNDHDTATARDKTDRKAKRRKSPAALNRNCIKLSDEKPSDEQKNPHNDNNSKSCNDNAAREILLVEPVQKPLTDKTSDKKTDTDDTHSNATKTADEVSRRNVTKPLKPRCARTSVQSKNGHKNEEVSTNPEKPVKKEDSEPEKTQFVLIDAKVKPAVSHSHKSNRKKRRSKLHVETVETPPVSPVKESDKDTDRYANPDQTAKEKTSRAKKNRKRSNSSNDEEKLARSPVGLNNEKEKSNEVKRVHSAEMREFTVIDDKEKNKISPLLLPSPPKVEYKIEYKYQNGILVKRFTPISADSTPKVKTLDTIEQAPPQ